MRCSRCQQENPAGVKFCGGCATSLQRLEGNAQPAPSYADVQRSLTDALEQQAATTEILRVISSSPTDGQPVFDAIACNARRLLGGHTVSVVRLIGDELHLMAFNAIDAAADALLQGFFPLPVDRFAVIARVVRERTPVIVTDMDTDPQVSARIRKIGQARVWRSVIWMPMVRDGASIGMIAVSRRDPGPFADSEVQRLKTFADQAVIAIENVFTEVQQRNQALTEAHAQVTASLEQQTATSEILRVISSSPTDLQPVFDSIAASDLPRRRPDCSRGEARNLT